MPEAIKFGIFDWIDQNGTMPLAEIYEQRLRMLEAADAGGFYAYHLAEHHGTPLGVAPSPNMFLSAAAQRTTRLRLGPMVQLLPLSNPMRNIEEVCILDSLSNGRVELGVGRGISREELAMYGVDIDEARDRFAESLDILLMGLSTGEVTYAGKHYNFDHAPIPLRPVQRPYPPLWYPTSSADRIPWVAQHGFNTLFGFTRTASEEIAAGVAQYRSEHAAHASDPDRLNGHVAQPLLGATRHVFVADTDDEAMRIARAAYAEFDRSYVTRPGRAPTGDASRRGDFDTVLAWGGIYAGSPSSVLRQVQDFIDSSGVNYFCGTFAFGNLTTAQILRSIGLFIDEVMPGVTSKVKQEA